MKFPRIEDIILFEDDNLLIVNKPPFVVSDQENAEGRIGLKDILKKYLPASQLCHRLDRETSGAIIAAKNPETYRFISMKLDRRQISKEYHALVRGVHNWNGQIVELPIRKQGSLKAIVDKNEGKRAETIVDILELFRDFTLVRAQPVTGRFHQVRVHMASIGSPLVGDNLYGGKPFFLSEVKRKYNTSKNEEEVAMLDRAALHSRRLSFEYPEGQSFSVEAPYPKDYEVTLKMIRKFNS